LELGCIRDCSHALLLWEDSESVRRAQSEQNERAAARRERWVKYRAEAQKEKTLRKLMALQAEQEEMDLAKAAGASALAEMKANRDKEKQKQQKEDEESGPDEAETDPNYSEVSDSHFSNALAGTTNPADSDCVSPEQDTQLTANTPHAGRVVFVVKVMNRRACAFVLAEQWESAAADYRRAIGLLGRPPASTTHRHPLFFVGC
jgi:hypothetical protein